MVLAGTPSRFTYVAVDPVSTRAVQGTGQAHGTDYPPQATPLSQLVQQAAG